jgi:GNAT superfamily N-acetyltransferase
MRPSEPSSAFSDSLAFRPATRVDLPAIVALLADDDLGRAREGASLAVYEDAFAALEADPNNEIIVGEVAGRVVACLQLTLIPGLSRAGAWRAVIEAVRVEAGSRGRGIGEALMAHAHARALARGARLAQLTSDARRAAAHRFYRRLGYAPSHVGFKRDLP